MSRYAPTQEPFRLRTGAAAYVPRAATDRALDAMGRWALASRGAALLVSGPPGIGKTMLLKVFAARLGARRCPVYIPYCALSARGLCEWVLHALGKPCGDDPVAALAQEVENRRRQGSELLLLVDDALRLPAETARMLAEWARPDGRGLRLVLVVGEGGAGAPVIELFEGAAERIALEAPLSLDEAAALLRVELECARADAETRALFDAATVADLHEISGGVPARLILEASRRLPMEKRVGLVLEEAADTSGGDREERRSAAWVTEANHPLPGWRRMARLRAPAPVAWAALGAAAGIAFTLALDALRGLPHPETNAPLAGAPPGAEDVSAAPPAPAREAHVEEGGERVAAETAAATARRAAAPEPPALPAQSAPASEQPERIVNTGVIPPGGWLAAALREQGVPAAISALIAREVGPLFDFRRSRPGHRFRIERTADGRLLDFHYVISPTEGIRLRLENDRYVARRETPDVASSAPLPPGRTSD